MSDTDCPEDSTLRRHCESAAAFRRQESLAGADSETPETPSEPAATPPPGAARETDRGGGVFDWLRRLFR